LGIPLLSTRKRPFWEGTIEKGPYSDPKCTNTEFELFFILFCPAPSHFELKLEFFKRERESRSFHFLFPIYFIWQGKGFPPLHLFLFPSSDII